MITYKKIIENMVYSEVRHYIEKKSGKYCFPDEETLKLSLDNKELGYPTFEIMAKVNYFSYRITGYIDEYGTVRVCSVNFTRTYCKVDAEGWPTGDETRTETKYIYGDALDTFAFDV